MRSSQKSGRGRGKNNRNNNNKNQSHSPNRVYESAGPEGKVRGTPQQIIDKYQALARDHQLSGDRVAAENFLQHAEHYVRLLNEAQALQAERQAQQNQQNQNSQKDQSGQQANQNAGAQNGGQPQPVDMAAQEQPDVVNEQPPADGLAAIDAAQDVAPDIVETPENAAAAPAPSRPRRPRPKPKVEMPAEPAADPAE